MQKQQACHGEKNQKKRSVWMYFIPFWKYEKLRLFLGATALTALITYGIDRGMNRMLDGKKDKRTERLPQCDMPPSTGMSYTYTLGCPVCSNTVKVSFKSKQMPCVISCARCDQVMALSFLNNHKERTK